MSGLQRRRVAGNNQSPAAASHSNTGENHTVAYDPQDNVISEAGRPRLTLMEEVLLMGLKDQQGYLSFWNDSISYVLRGCILIELALQNKIAMVNDTARRRLPLGDRYVEVIDDTITGEVLLDETIKIMKQSEPLSVASWIDYLSGETWNISKISYQLKQVRERLSKGLVDKGVLRTEKKNFFLFDMATHPIADASIKEDIKRRVLTLLTASAIDLPSTKMFPASIPNRYIRAIALVASAYAANVLENVLVSLSYDARDAAIVRADEILSDYAEFPFDHRKTGWATSLYQAVESELKLQGTESLKFEIVAAVLRVYSQLDSVL